MSEIAPRIFFSVADEDRWVAAEVMNRVSEHLPGAQPASAIDDADAGVLVTGPHYSRSNGESTEPAEVFARGIPVFQLQMGEGPLLRGLPGLVIRPDDDGAAHETAFDVAAAWIAEVLSAPTVTLAPVVSPSVGRVLRNLPESVPAATIVSELLKLHPEYGAHTGGRLHVPLSEGARERPAAEWLAAVRTLYRLDLVPELHGRTVIRGLALLEPNLDKSLVEHGFLHALEEEIEPPLLHALSPEGRRLWESGDVPTYGDRPAQEDELNREIFAEALAGMIEEERRREGAANESFLVHLHGPWGSGKTTLLGFLAERLRSADPPWVVVEFNAWRHERLGSPWWSLMTAIHEQGRTGAGGRARLWLTWLRWWWQIKPALPSLLALVVLIALVWIGVDQGFFEKDAIKDAGDVAKGLGAIVALTVALAGVARSLVSRTSKATASFAASGPDPLGVLVSRFQLVVAKIGRPVIVFVDDVDRCQAGYLVEVLNGIQTLLIEAPVTYVVAADRRWLYDSYAKVYADFRSVATEPGRPMGHLFLEKTFQLSASVPALAPAVRDRYWERLVTGVPAEDGAGRAERLEGASLDEVLDIAGASQALPAAEQAATIRAASLQVAAPEVQREIEHRLIPFANLIDPNPRAMKRLVNAYRIELQRMIAEGRRVGRGAVTPEQLALWTVISLRWPLLADELAARPEMAEDAGSRRGELKRLLERPEVAAVLRGEGVNAKLTEHAIRALVGLGPGARSSTADAPGDDRRAQAVA